MTVVDPDAPTAHMLMALPTWEEWLQQHGFTPQERTRFTALQCALQWNREWRDQGRGWKVRVAPSTQTINVIVYNNPLRYGRQLAMVSVGERSVTKVVQRIITEIERKVSDATKKRRIMAYTSSVPWEDREDAATLITNQPEEPTGEYATLKKLAQMMRESAEPAAEEPPADVEAAVARVQPRCFPLGQRVRIRRPESGTLSNALGTVVSASPNACYVAVDHYVAAGDPDPFRFEGDELEPVYEQQQQDDPDQPEPYSDMLDYVAPLLKLGYRERQGHYNKNLYLDVQHENCLHISVQPLTTTLEAVIRIDYLHGLAETLRIQDMVLDVIDVVDRVRELEGMVAESTSVMDFSGKLKARKYPCSSALTSVDHLIYLFGESVADDDAFADPKHYVDELQRHYDVINAFRKGGARMRRKPGADRPHYEMFYISSAVTDLSYDIFIEPQADNSWNISAQGDKSFQNQDESAWVEEFDIEQTWTIPADAGAELDGYVDDIMAELRRHRGPSEPSVMYENVDEISDIDLERYVKTSAHYNPVQLLSAADVRKIVKDTGYRVNWLNYSKRTTGYSARIIPGTDEQVREMRHNPDAEANRMLEMIRRGIINRLPMLGKIERGMYNLDDKLHVHCWSWGGLRYKEAPDDARNLALYVDILPSDHQRRGNKGVMLPEAADNADPDKIEDMAAYLRTTPDAVAAIKEAGYGYINDCNGRPRWQKYWPLPKPLRRGEQAWQVPWTDFWGSPDPWGCFTYGLVSGAECNNYYRDIGSIIVRPVKRGSSEEDTDYATSVRRVLLKVAALVKSLPDTDSPDEMRKFVHAGMLQIQADVNSQADPTWRPPEEVGEALDDPDDPALLVNRARVPKLGEIVNITCPRCGDVHQSVKNWPDNASKEWGFPCGKCRAHIPLVNVVLDSLADDDDTSDTSAYANSTLGMDVSLTELGYRYEARDDFPYWSKVMTQAEDEHDDLLFVVTFPPRALTWTFQIYTMQPKPWEDLTEEQQDVWLSEVRQHYNDDAVGPKEALRLACQLYYGSDDSEKEHSFRLDSTSPGRLLRTLKTDLQFWEEEFGRKNLPQQKLKEDIAPQADADADVVNPAEYSASTFDPVQFLEAHGWKKHSEAARAYYSKTFATPRPYVLGGMTFTGVQVRIGLERNTLFHTTWLGLYFVGADDHGMGIHGYDLNGQLLYQWEEAAHHAPDNYYDDNMPIRRFAFGIDRVLAHVAWPEKATASVLASSQVKQAVDAFVKGLNQQAETALHPEIRPFGESADDPDETEMNRLMRGLPVQTYVTFNRSVDEDRLFAEGHFPGLPMEDAFTKQLLMELEGTHLFDMSKVKVARPVQITQDDYTVSVIFQGYESDGELLKKLQSAYDVHGMAGSFNIEQFRPDPVAEALDPDADETEIVRRLNQLPPPNYRELVVALDRVREMEAILTYPAAQRRPVVYDGIGGYIAFDEEVVFGDRKRMAIQVIAADTDDETGWSQGVLFGAEGHELGVTDVRDFFLGEFTVADEGTNYTVKVVPGKMTELPKLTPMIRPQIIR